MCPVDKETPLSSFASLVMRPGLIWGCAHGDDGTTLIDDCDAAQDSAFRWLHLDLADQRTVRWLERSGMLPEAIHDLMLTRDTHQQSLIDDGTVGIVLQDFERNFSGSPNFQIGALHIAMTPRLMLTGRYHPLHSADIIKQRLLQGVTVSDGAAALDIILSAISGSLADRVHPLMTTIQTAEDEFLNEKHTPSTRELVAIRQRVARPHRLIRGMRATLSRLEHDPDLPVVLQPPVEWHVQRLNALDADASAAETQLRLLRDELDLQAAQRTNQNVYFLSVISALLLPATLVTGVFGMNTGGMPFAHHPAGTAVAACLAIALSGMTWLFLRARR